MRRRASTDVDVAELAALITARLENDEHHLARAAMRHHYFDDLQVGDSTDPLPGCGRPSWSRCASRLVGAAADPAEDAAAITA